MAEFKTLRLDEILVPKDRLRKVNENKAFLIGQSVAAGELIHPVTVYRTPNGERAYTLAAGATRYRGHELHGLQRIDALVRKLDKAGARRIEIEENLFRDDLNALERALHVVEYRKLWEEEHGQIEPKGGRPRGNSAKLAEFPEDSAQGHFFGQALDELGLSRRAVERAQFIGSKLTPALRDAIRDKPEAGNQRMLEKLAALEPDRQRKVAAVFAENQDIERALYDTDDNAAARERLPVSESRKGTVLTNYQALGEKKRRETLRELFQRFPDDFEWAVANVRPGEPAGGGAS